MVIGADGRHSLVAKIVEAERYNEKPEILTGYYSYFSGLPVDGFETFVRPGRGFVAWPTNDDLTLVIGGWPHSEFEQNRKDVEGNWMKMFDFAPEFGERMGAAKREERIVGTAVANYFRNAGASAPRVAAASRCRLRQPGGDGPVRPDGCGGHLTIRVLLPGERGRHRCCGAKAIGVALRLKG